MEKIEKFKSYYKETSNKLNKKIEQFNNEIKKENNSIINSNINLFANLNSDGKLFRGTLINLGYNLLKEENLEYSYDLALAFEIFQTAILVHDDIIDNDDLRRGKKTIHSYNKEKYFRLTNNLEQSKKVSESIGICMGDMGLFLANQVIVSSYKNDSKLGEILTYFNDIVLKTIKGEILDVTLPFLEKHNLNDLNTKDQIIQIYELKTAYYTIIGPLCLGMILAGANKKQLAQITEFGYNVGIAFQMQDDLLGIYSNNNKLGKTVGSDIEEFKQTILYSYVKENSSYYKELMKIYGKESSLENIEKIKKIFDDSKAKEYTLKEIAKLFNNAVDIVDNLDFIKEEKKDILKGFIEYLKNREK